MNSVKLTKETIDFIHKFSNTNVFSEIDGGVQVDRTLLQHPNVTIPTIKEVRTIHIPVRDGSSIQARYYIPQTPKKKLPLILYFHGGGWVIGDLDYMDGGCRYLAHHAEAVVLSIDYRLAPEFPYPTQIHDAYDSLIWAAKNTESLPIDVQNIHVAGDSAGGNLAASLCATSIELKGPTIRSQLLVYPVLDATTKRNSYNKYGKGFGLDSDEMQEYIDHYVQQNESLSHYTISPILYEKKHLLPPTLIVSAQYDILNDEAIDYIQALKKANVHAQIQTINGVVHSFFSKIAYFEKETSEATYMMAQFMKSIAPNVELS